MYAHAVPIKTERGWRALREHEFSGSRAQRALLVMLDGRRSLDRLAPVMESLGLDWHDLEQLADAGLVGWAPRGAHAVDIEL